MIGKDGQIISEVKSELLNFSHPTITLQYANGKEVTVRQDAINFLEEVDGGETCLVGQDFAGGGFVVKGNKKQVAAKLNWAIEE